MLIHEINDCQDLHMRRNVKINMDEQCSSLLHFGFCGMAHVFFSTTNSLWTRCIAHWKITNFQLRNNALIKYHWPNGVNKSSLIIRSQSFILIYRKTFLKCFRIKKGTFVINKVVSIINIIFRLRSNVIKHDLLTPQSL